jgi:hypothetical protein
MDFILLILVAILLYAFLRSHGGEGVSIKTKLAPVSTRRGKIDRVVALTLVSTAVAIVVYSATKESEERWGAVVIPFLVGGVTFLVLHFNKKK